MLHIAKQFKQILLTAIFLHVTVITWAQVKPQPHTSKQFVNFNKLTAEAGMQFTFPEEFKEIRAIHTASFPFDYAVALPGKEFEIWFMVRAPQNYPRMPENFSVDSAYNYMAEIQAKAFTGDGQAITRSIPKDILANYNADQGKTYLLNLQNLAITRHYKYALLVTLEKDHTGTVLVVCLGNDKGTDFFQNINKAVTCLKFK